MQNKIIMLALLLAPAILTAQTTVNMHRGTFSNTSIEQDDGSNQKRPLNAIDGLGRRTPTFVPVIVDGKVLYYNKEYGYLVNHNPQAGAYDSMAEQTLYSEPAPVRPNPHADFDSPKVKAWPFEALGADKLNGALSGLGVNVAVFDSGISPHNQFTAGMVDVLDMTGSSKVDDEYGHGTAVAGIIVGNGFGDTGFRGIAPGAKIKSYKIATKNGVTDNTYIAKAINMVFEYNKENPNNKISIINISYGLSGDDPTLKNALRSAYESGITIIAPSGNSGQGFLVYPAAYDFVIAVGGISYHRKPMKLSNFGEGLAVVAPAAGIYAPDNFGEYSWVRGTSFASAYITGSVALISQAYKNKYGRLPTPQEVYNTLQKISVQLPDVPKNKQGFGLPDVSKINAAI